MKTEKDYEELLKFLNKHDVKYCIVGAFALVFHAEPRYTKDMDIWVQGPYGRQTVNFIDRENLIKSKKISNRPQDQADLAKLQEYD